MNNIKKMDLNILDLNIDLLYYSRDDLNFLINESKCEIYNLRNRLEKEIKKWKPCLEDIKDLKDKIYKETKKLESYELYLSVFDEDLESRSKNYSTFSFKNSYNPPTPESD
jgi:hypothetical protein